AMIVVMKAGATQQQVEGVVERLQCLGVRGKVIAEAERTLVAALTDHQGHANGEGHTNGYDELKQALEAGEGVEKVVQVLAPYKMASSQLKSEPTCVRARQLQVGADRLGIIAGPCAVESKEQILQVAEVVKECGGTGLRGGAFKPRTSPYSFQGLK